MLVLGGLKFLMSEVPLHPLLDGPELGEGRLGARQALPRLLYRGTSLIRNSPPPLGPP